MNCTLLLMLDLEASYSKWNIRRIATCSIAIVIDGDSLGSHGQQKQIVHLTTSHNRFRTAHYLDDVVFVAFLFEALLMICWPRCFFCAAALSMVCVARSDWS